MLFEVEDIHWLQVLFFFPTAVAQHNQCNDYIKLVLQNELVSVIAYSCLLKLDRIFFLLGIIFRSKERGQRLQWNSCVETRQETRHGDFIFTDHLHAFKKQI